MEQWREDQPPTNVVQIRFWSNVLCVLSLLLALALPQGFSLVSLVFFPPQKKNISTFQFNQDRGPPSKPAEADMALWGSFFLSAVSLSQQSHDILNFS